MQITLSTLVLSAAITGHVQLPVAHEVDGHRVQHVDENSDDHSLVSTVETATYKLAGRWFDKPSQGAHAPHKQSKYVLKIRRNF